MNDGSLILNDVSIDESQQPRADDFEVNIDPTVGPDEPELVNDDEWPTHPTFDADAMTAAVIEVSSAPARRVHDRHDRSRLVLAAALSIASHLGVGAICLAFASVVICIPLKKNNARLGGAVSQGEMVDASTNTYAADLPRDQSQPPPLQSSPSQERIDASTNDVSTPIDAFAQADTDRKVSEETDPAETPPMIGLQSNPLAPPTFVKHKSPAAAADSAVTASASVAAHNSLESAASNPNPPSLTASHGHVIGYAHPQGMPGGHRDGFDLDERGIPIPDYPTECRRRREEGLVKLDVEIMPSGAVGRIAIFDDAGFPRLADAAVASARTARFDPQTFDGQPTACHVMVPYRFMLR